MPAWQDRSATEDAHAQTPPHRTTRPNPDVDTGRAAARQRPRDEVQCPRLQGGLERPQTAHRHSGCGVPVAAILTSASMHDSQAAIPLSHLTAARVTNLYDMRDAAYCSAELRAHCKDLGHVPLTYCARTPHLDHSPRGGEKLEFDPAGAVRYNERTVAVRMNARLKDESAATTFGARATPR